MALLIHQRWINQAIKRLLLCGLLMLFAQTLAAQAAQKPPRIVSLAPHITELLFAAGAGQQIVATDMASNYPKAAQDRPKIAGSTHVDEERLLQLHPDLILAWQPNLITTRLKRLGIPLMFINPQSIRDIPRLWKKIGKLSQQKSATTQANQFSQKLQQLKKRYQHRRSVRVFYQLWPQPLMTVSPHTLIGEAIQLCGGKNVFPSIPKSSAIISPEAVITANPEVILGSSQLPSELTRWKHWSQLSAVQHQQLKTLHADWLTRPGPRFIRGVTELCRVIDSAR